MLYLPETARNSLEEHRKEAEVPGISVTTFKISKDTLPEIIPMVDGYTNATSKSLVTPETVFGAASLSKPVFSYLVYKMATSGDLGFGLDTPLRQVLEDPRFSDDKYYSKLTARMVLSHQSGLPIKEDETAETIAFEFEPGAQYGYSNLGFSYLQNVIKAQTGLGLEELGQKYIFVPLGMNHSTFNFPDGTPPNAACSLHTTGEDYARFMVGCLKEKEMFESIASLSGERDKWAIGQGLTDSDLGHVDWGLGWGLQTNSEGKVTRAFHSGDMNEWRAFVAVNLEDEDNMTGIVYFSNSRNGLVLAEEIVSPVVELEHGFNYIFQKFGFARKLEPGWKELELARVMEIIRLNEPRIWNMIQESLKSDSSVPAQSQPSSSASSSSQPSGSSSSSSQSSSALSTDVLVEQAKPIIHSPFKSSVKKTDSSDAKSKPASDTDKKRRPF